MYLNLMKTIKICMNKIKTNNHPIFTSMGLVFYDTIDRLGVSFVKIKKSPR